MNAPEYDKVMAGLCDDIANLYIELGEKDEKIAVLKRALELVIKQAHDICEKYTPEVTYSKEAVLHHAIAQAKREQERLTMKAPKKVYTTLDRGKRIEQTRGAIITEKDKRVAELETMLRHSTEDSCADDTAIRELARGILPDIDIDGDSYGVPPIVDVVEGIVKKIKDMERVIDEQVELIDRLLQRANNLTGEV